ncbi:hypothetical protein [Gorillibacterium sp. sgz5001074]|uniref:hypothetical protein n=1 Tax=Gorillibacterium sp. sgz5001074 TaxID=3446695 RepID=UPI003F66F76D
MSRLNEIIDNHDNLDQLFSIIKHYGVNAQFVADSLCKEFQSRCESEDAKESGDSEADQAFAQDIVEDLKQFTARF